MMLRLSHMCTCKISALFQEIRSHDLCDAGAELSPSESWSHSDASRSICLAHVFPWKEFWVKEILWRVVERWMIMDSNPVEDTWSFSGAHTRESSTLSCKCDDHFFKGYVQGWQCPCLWGAGMAQWWEHSPPTNTVLVRFPDPASRGMSLLVLFSSLLFSSLLFSAPRGFLRVVRFPLSSKATTWLEFCFR